MAIRASRALSLAAAAFLASAGTPAAASVVAPPTLEEVETLFVEGCWVGLRRPGVFHRVVESSTLSLRRLEDVDPAEHYGGRAADIYYLPRARCTIRAHLRDLDVAEAIIQRMSQIVALQPVAAEGPNRSYRSPERSVEGGRVGVELSFTPPPPRPGRYRPMYPPSFTLSISVYFVADE